MKKMFAEWVGWYGVVAILLAYVLVSFSLVTVDNLAYQLLNVTGAVGIVVDALHQKNYQPAVLNIIWAAVAFVAIVRMAF